MPVLLRSLLLLVTLLLPGWAVAEDYIAGIHYDTIQPPVPVQGGKPEIVEVFNFKCPHCDHLRPVFDKWAQKNKDRFTIKHLPVYWGQQTDMPVRAFFTAEFMGKGEAMRTALFKSHFQDKGNIEEQGEVVKLAQEVGLDGKQFAANLPSFGVAGKLAQARTLQKAYNVHSTPMAVVNGRYKVDANHGGGSWDKLLEIAEFLAINNP